MAGRRQRRDDAHRARRHAYYLGWIGEAETGPGRVSRAFDYVRALLAEQSDDQRQEVTERVVTGLLAIAASLRPATTKGDR